MCCSHLVPEMTWQVSSNPRYQVSPVPMGLIFRVGRKGLRSLPSLCPPEVSGDRAALASHRRFREPTPILATLCGD